MGPGEDCMDRWLSWFRALTPEQRTEYVERPDVPPAWKARLESWQRKEAAGPEWYLLPVDDADLDDDENGEEV